MTVWVIWQYQKLNFSNLDKLLKVFGAYGFYAGSLGDCESINTNFECSYEKYELGFR